MRPEPLHCGGHMDLPCPSLHLCQNQATGSPLAPPPRGGDPSPTHTGSILGHCHWRDLAVQRKTTDREQRAGTRASLDLAMELQGWCRQGLLSWATSWASRRGGCTEEMPLLNCHPVSVPDTAGLERLQSGREGATPEWRPGRSGPTLPPSLPLTTGPGPRVLLLAALGLQSRADCLHRLQPRLVIHPAPLPVHGTVAGELLPLLVPSLYRGFSW